MKNNMHRKFTALIALLTLIIALLPSGLTLVSAEDASSENVIKINTVDDLIALAQKCENDTWSKGKTVVLNADLDVTDTEFKCIPVFSGLFNGNGYTISGYKPADVGLANGFFRYISKDAEVKNLTVKGVVNTDEDGECVGGIVGVNMGTVSFCTFNGTISSNQSVGGIAGENAKSGIIRNCTALGTVDAPYEAGGICGSNHGIIRDCVNRSVVNNDRAFIDEMDEENVSWIINSISTENDIHITAGTDIGGIAGYSDGTILNCTNNATIGYEHTGYNVGGVVGRQAGIISYCTNNGNVFGRKDVGGICGQMEPFISVDEAASVADAITELHDLVDKLLDDLSDTKNGISNDLSDVKKHADVAMDLGKDISTELTDFANSNIDAMNLVADEVSYVLEKMPDILDSLDLSVTAARALGDDLKKISDDLDILDKLDKNAYSEAAHGRLTLTSAVGGHVSTDNASPEKDITVKLTVSPDDGYVLKTIVLLDENSTNVAYTDNGDGTYTFVMPEENVVVRTVYSYVGNFYTQSNAGGTISESYSESTEQLKVTVKPNSGYTFTTVTEGDTQIDISEFTYDEAQGTYTAEISEKQPEGIVLISTEFTKEETSHTVTLVSSTGGTITSDKVLATPGDTVTVTVAESSDYILSSLGLVVNGESTDLIAARTAEEALENANKYTFTMPEADARVEAVFKYSDSSKDSDDTVMYTESNLGGSMYFVKNPTSNDYVVYIIPSSGYEVAESSALSVYTGAKAGQETTNLAGQLATSQLTQYGTGYSYTINYTQYDTPIRIYGEFTKTETANTITTTTGTGGSASASAVSANPDDTISLAVVPSSNYRISKISIVCNDKEITYTEKEDTTNIYEFTMPDGNVDITVEFAPIMFIPTSNYGGTVTTSVSGNTLKFTVKPDDGYTLDEAPKVIDGNGREVTLIKRTSGVFSYEFDITEQVFPIYADINFVGATDYEVVENSKDTINTQSKNLNSYMSQIQDTSDEIQKLVTDEYGEIIDAETLLQDTDKVNRLVELIIELTQEVSDAGESATAVVSSLNTLSNVLVPYATDAAKAVHEDTDKALDDLDDCLAYLQQAGNQTKAVVDYLNTQPSVKFTDLSEDFSGNVSSLFDEMENISTGLEKVNTDFSSYSDIVLDDFRAVNDKVNDILELIVDMASNVESAYTNDGGLFEDVSDEDLASVTDGKVSLCTNNGTVNADLNVGGIVGSMSVDTEDPEDNAAGSVEWNVRNTYVTKCVLTSCTNYGDVISKNDGVGAIAGCQGIGVITNCTACGTVESTEGEYVGGIAGQSSAIIRFCDSICSLKGTNHIGGIAGLGYRIYNCNSLPVITDGKNSLGAIAGQVKFEDDVHCVDSENVHDNKFVSDSLGGIDGISYSGIAEQLTYEELLAVPDISTAFSHLTITFKVDGTVIEQDEYKYGTSLSDVTFPKIPDKEGYYGRWPEVTGKAFEGNMTLTAEYYENITTVKSDESTTVVNEDKGTSLTRNLVLIDGVFDSDAKLEGLVSNETLPEEITNGCEAVVYAVRLSNTTIPETAKIRLYNSTGKTVKVYEKKDGTWTEIDTTDYGSYQQVILTQGSGTFALVAQKTSYLKYIVIGGAVVCVILIIIIIKLIVSGIKKGKAKKKAAKEAEANDEK